MSQDLISVIIPVYKAADYIKERGFSIINQTYPNIEFIFVEDCSPDNTWQVLQEFKSSHPDKNIILYHNEKNLGPGPARNKGFELSSGKYVYFADADDEADINLLQKAYDKLEAEQSDFVLFGHQRIEGDKIENQNLHKLLMQPKSIEHLKKNPFLPAVVPWNKVVRKSFLEKNQIIFPPIIYGDDFCWSMQIIYASHKASFINELLYKYIDTAGCLTSGNHFMCLIECFNFNKALASKQPDKEHVLTVFILQLIKNYTNKWPHLNERQKEQLSEAFFNLPEIKHLEQTLQAHPTYSWRTYKLYHKFLNKEYRNKLKMKQDLFRSLKAILPTKEYKSQN